jgi:hypothetical protein
MSEDCAVELASNRVNDDDLCIIHAQNDVREVFYPEVGLDIVDVAGKLLAVVDVNI